MAGERLILDDSKQVDLSQYASSSSVIKLGVVVDYEKSDSIVNGYGDTVHTKWTPSVRFIMGETLDSGVFELAEVTIDFTSITSITNTSENFITLQKLAQNTAMEIGSNDNGTYVKFENGFLICFGASLTKDSTSNGWTYLLAFPHMFTEVLTQHLYATRGSNSPNTYLFQSTYLSSYYSLTNFNILGVTSDYNASSSHGNREFTGRGIAFGFWK